MVLFDNDVQQLKYEVISEVARLAFMDELTPENLMNVANIIVPEGKPRLRCCIYKERAIVNERVKIALGGNKQNPCVVEVLPIACDECPVDGIQVTQACRGCIAHRCVNVCPRKAITVVDRHAVIDKEKCVECGRCIEACSYGAIMETVRPCVSACKPKALTINGDTKKALIDNEKCISCGACVYRCPFGAVVDKSYITQAIRMLLDSKNNKAYKTYAIVAPAFSSQYATVPGITTEKVTAAIKALGFHAVIEAALGADMVAGMEALELVEKGFLTSSCCPAFVSYVRKYFPSLAENISHNLSPMAQIAKVIKQMDPNSRIIFFGPCIAKKQERQLESVAGYVDCVLTFEEMQALFNAKNIELAAMEGVPLDNASFFGRIFARSGGLSEAVAQGLKEHGISQEQFAYKPVACSGIAECRAALLKADKKVLDENFIEGMICEGGCIGGPACLSHSSKDKDRVDKYGKTAYGRTIEETVSLFNYLAKK
jgi:[FeFe] hydrogenase (group B1/B3)